MNECIFLDKIVFYFFSRESLNQLKMMDDGLHDEIKDAEKTIALAEEKCALITQCIPEMMELEKTETDTVSHTVHIYTNY